MFFSNFRNSKRKKKMDIINNKRLDTTDLKEACRFQKIYSGKKKRVVPSPLEIEPKKRRWCFAPVEPDFANETVSIRNETEAGYDHTLFFNSLKETYELFQNIKGIELPSVFETTTLNNTARKNSVLSLSFSHFRSLQMLNHTLFLISLAEKETFVESDNSYTPQYPFLVQMYNTRGDFFDTQRTICFLKIVREWLVSSVDFCPGLNSSETGVFERIKRQESNHQMVLVNSLHKILNVIFCYHGGDAVSFSSFLHPDSIGMVILYHVLFVDSIDRIHWKLIEELGEFFKTLDVEETPSPSVVHEIRSRHLSLAVNFHKLTNLPRDKNGHVILTQRLLNSDTEYGFNALDFVIQVYSFICDPQLNNAIAMSLLCYISSSFIKPLKVQNMEEFANNISTPFKERSAKRQEQKITIEVERSTGISSISKSEMEKFKNSLKDSTMESLLLQDDLAKEVFKQRKPACEFITSFDPLEYAKAVIVHSDTKKPSVFASSDTHYKVDALQMLSFYHFIMELEKTAIMKSRYCPQILLLKEFENPNTRFPFSLNSSKKVIYIDEIYLCRY